MDCVAELPRDPDTSGMHFVSLHPTSVCSKGWLRKQLVRQAAPEEREGWRICASVTPSRALRSIRAQGEVVL